MNKSSLIEVLSMSGYAAYVWSSFGLTVILLIACFIYSKRKQKKAIRKSEELAKLIKSNRSD